MSLFDDASLAMIPSAYKDGKLYSIKPSDGSGDFTFTRGSNLAATRVDENGLIEKGRENLLLQSNQFDTTWVQYQGGSVTSGQAGYDGTNNAWKLNVVSSQSFSGLYQDISGSYVGTQSIYAKAGTLDHLGIVNMGGANFAAWFDLTNGTIGTQGSSNVDASIESVGNGWYRLSVTQSGAKSYFQIKPSDGENTPSGSDGYIYIQDAQLEQGLVATDYIETTTTTAQAGILEDMPRLDYSGGASCPSLLLEPQRSNLVTQSEYFADASWSKTAAGTGTIPILTSNYGISPDGLQNASRMQMNLNGGVSGGDISYLTYFLTSIAPATNSVYLKSLGSDATMTFRCGSTFKSILVTSEWQRFDVTDASGTDRLQLLLYGNSDSQSADLLIYGSQLEQGSYPTSYIPTYGTSQTRSSDSCANLSLTTSTDFTIFFEAKDFCLINGNTGGSYDDVQFVFSPSGGAYDSGGSYHIYNNTLYYYDGSTNTDFGVIYNNQTDSKFALVKRGNQGIIYANGVKKTELTLPSGADAKVINWDAINITPSLTDAQGDVFGPNYKQLLKFDTALSDSELAALTTI